MLHTSGTGALTDRYVAEVVRRIPAGRRGDVADELRATIADTVEARGPEDPEAAEREVLTEMGDPVRLAARYADRPLALIGAGLYPTYIRLLAVLLLTVLPVVVAVSAVLDVLDGKGAGAVIGGAVGTVVSLGAQMIAWLTVVFALAEWSGKSSGKSSGAPGRAWTPDELPRLRATKERDATVYAGLSWHSLLVALIVWQHTAQPYRTDSGTHIDVLDPGLWSGWIWPVLAGLAGLVVLDVIRAVRAPTRSLALWNIAAQAVFTLPMAWILYRREFFNPAFLSDVNGGWQTPDAFYTVVVLLVLAGGAREVVRRFREARA
ncbi:HAAS signaling domain-containing protein [Streptomyces sp. NPDC059814]|uniref:HAAS signaling domain-containing protein n=1 Tax=unclassified Streptomyces TaxID=2593676 RepID=UPI0036485448